MTSEFWVARLNSEDAAVVWPKVEAMLAPAIAGSSGLFTVEDVADLVTRKNAGTLHGWSLWILAERDQILGAWTTKVQHFPREMVVEVVFAGGTNMDRWYPIALGETDKFAAEIGCRRLHCGGRSGWAKFGWSRLGHLYERVVT